MSTNTASYSYSENEDRESEEYSSDFHGKQADERILFELRPHWLRKVIALLQVSAVTCALGLLLWYRGALDFPLVEASHVRTMIYLLLGWLFSTWYAFKAADDSVTYLTDRRLVRFDPLPFISRNRRTMFWHEVAKTRSAAGNWISSLFGVGEVVLVGKHADEQIKVKWAYYYEDLAQYMDKLIYLTMTNPQKLKTIHTFVTKPKWQRYPQYPSIQAEATLLPKEETRKLAERISQRNR